mgnify:FL=1
MNINTYRFCHQSKIIFYYYVENINKIPLNWEQQKILDEAKHYFTWLISIGGYFDKTIKTKIIESLSAY